jgi:putative zinc finger protein
MAGTGNQVKRVDVNHTYAEEHDLVEAYLAGRLSESERDAFEAHYFACETCLEQLETASDFREGMREVGAEDAARAAAAGARLGVLGGLALLSRGRRLALGGALLLLVALPLGFLLARNRGLERRLSAAQAAQAAGAEQRIADLEDRLRGLERSAAGDRRRLADELAKERQARAAAEKGGPQVNVPIFMLAAVRSGDTAGREPVNQIPLSSTDGSIILDLELATVDFPSYRASLHAADGREIWQGRGLRPDSRDALVIVLPSGMLSPGVYELTIEGAGDAGRWVAVAAYPFRVVRRS